MPTSVQYPSSSTLKKRVEQLQAAAQPNSAALKRAREDFRLIVAEDHYHMLIDGIDRYGQPRAPLADSTLKNPKRGPGPSLIPHFWQSRFIFNLEVLWQTAGDRMILVKRFRDILSKPSKNRGAEPFAQYHLAGATKPGTAWVLPKRDVGGVTRKGFRELTLRLNKLTKDLATYWKGRS